MISFSRVFPTSSQSIRRALGAPSLQEPLALVQALECLRAMTGTVNTAIGSVATTAGQLRCFYMLFHNKLCYCNSFNPRLVMDVLNGDQLSSTKWKCYLPV